MSFPNLNWIKKSKFIELIELQKKHNQTEYKIYPYLDLIEGAHVIDSQIFIGKLTINTGESYLSEAIGAVAKNFVTNDWEIKFSDGLCSQILNENFFVLYIQDPNSFYWESFDPTCDQIKNNVKSIKDHLPLNSPCFGSETENFYHFIGRSRFYDPETKAPHNLDTNGQLNVFNEKIPPVFGEINSFVLLFYASVNKLLLQFEDFDILCFRPSPLTLKMLTGYKIRHLINNSHTSLKEINENSSGKIYLPKSIINFLENLEIAIEHNYKFNNR